MVNLSNTKSLALTMQAAVVTTQEMLHEMRIMSVRAVRARAEETQKPVSLFVDRNPGNDEFEEITDPRRALGLLRSLESITKESQILDLLRDNDEVGVEETENAINIVLNRLANRAPLSEQKLDPKLAHAPIKIIIVAGGSKSSKAVEAQIKLSLEEIGAAGDFKIEHVPFSSIFSAGTTENSMYFMDSVKCEAKPVLHSADMLFVEDRTGRMKPRSDSDIDKIYLNAAEQIEISIQNHFSGTFNGQPSPGLGRVVPMLIGSETGWEKPEETAAEFRSLLAASHSLDALARELHPPLYEYFQDHQLTVAQKAKEFSLVALELVAQHAYAKSRSGSAPIDTTESLAANIAENQLPFRIRSMLFDLTDVIIPQLQKAGIPFGFCFRSGDQFLATALLDFIDADRNETVARKSYIETRDRSGAERYTELVNALVAISPRAAKMHALANYRHQVADHTDVVDQIHAVHEIEAFLALETALSKVADENTPPALRKYYAKNAIEDITVAGYCFEMLHLYREYAACLEKVERFPKSRSKIILNPKSECAVEFAGDRLVVGPNPNRHRKLVRRLDDCNVYNFRGQTAALIEGFEKIDQLPTRREREEQRKKFEKEFRGEIVMELQAHMEWYVATIGPKVGAIFKELRAAFLLSDAISRKSPQMPVPPARFLACPPAPRINGFQGKTEMLQVGVEGQNNTALDYFSVLLGTPGTKEFRNTHNEKYIFLDSLTRKSAVSKHITYEEIVTRHRQAWRAGVAEIALFDPVRRGDKNLFAHKAVEALSAGSRENMIRLYEELDQYLIRNPSQFDQPQHKDRAKAVPTAVLVDFLLKVVPPPVPSDEARQYFTRSLLSSESVQDPLQEYMADLFKKTRDAVLSAGREQRMNIELLNCCATYIDDLKKLYMPDPAQADGTSIVNEGR